MSKNILAIVEGDSKEPELLKKLFDIYNITDREIFSYGATIYDLYNKIEKEYGLEYEDIDIVLFLKSLNNKKYNEREVEITAMSLYGKKSCYQC